MVDDINSSVFVCFEQPEACFFSIKVAGVYGHYTKPKKNVSKLLTVLYLVLNMQ